VDCFFFAGDHLVSSGLAGHGVGDGHLGGFVIELIDLLVVLGFPVDENAADDDEVFGLVLGNDAGFDLVGDRLGDGGLGGAEHLDGLLGTLDRDLRDQNGRGLDGQIGREDGEEIRVAFALTRQSVGEGVADRAVLAADEQINVRDLVAFADQCLADVHGHESISRA